MYIQLIYSSRFAAVSHKIVAQCYIMGSQMRILLIRFEIVNTRLGDRSALSELVLKIENEMTACVLLRRRGVGYGGSEKSNDFAHTSIYIRKKFEDLKCP